jgi:hypothetical protein
MEKNVIINPVVIIYIYIYTSENYTMKCKGKRIDIVFASMGFELTLYALELQHQSLNLICRTLSHLVTSAMKKK